MMQSPSAFNILFCSLYWISMYFAYSYRVSRIPLLRQPKAGIGYLVFLILIIIYSVFDFTGGDFSNYKILYDNYWLYGTTSHLEPIYEYFIELSSRNYFIWRFFVWTIASAIWVNVLRILKQDVDFSALIFLLIVFYHFVGARQSIGFGLLFWGLTKIVNRSKNRVWEIIIGVIIMLISLCFHKTMIVYLLIIVFACIPFRKWGIIATLILFPIVYKYLDVFLEYYMAYLGTYSEDASEVFNRYLESDLRAVSNFNGILRLFIERTPIILLLIYSINNVFFKKRRLPVYYEILLRMSYIMIYMSFLFIGKEVSAYISPRMWDASLYPLTLFMAYYLYPVRKKNKVTIFLMLLFVFFLFIVTYNIYKFI